MGKKLTFTVSEKNTPNGILLIVTDTNLIGKSFEEKNTQLDLTKKFYSGEEKTVEEVKKLFKNAYIIHLTGENSVTLGQEMSLVQKIITVDNVPHAEVLLE